MRRTGKYYWLNLSVAFVPIIGFAMMMFMSSKPRVTDWLNCIPTGVGIGANGKLA